MAERRSSDLVVTFWQFYESLTGTREGLRPEERSVAAICDRRQEVNSDGFDSYFRHWGGDSARDALLALSDVLGADWTALLREAMGLHGTDYPTTANEREARLDGLELDEHFEELDGRFFDLEAATEADRLLSEQLPAGPHLTYGHSRVEGGDARPDLPTFALMPMSERFVRVLEGRKRLTRPGRRTAL